MPLSARWPVLLPPPGRPWSRPLPAVLLVVLLMGLAVPAAADPGAREPVVVVVGTVAGAGPIKPGYSRLVDSSAVLQPALADGSAPRAVFVQLAAVAAAQVWSAALARGAGPVAAAVAVRAQRQVVRTLATGIAAAARGATVLFMVTDAVPGLGLLATPDTIRALAGRPGVVRISAIVPKVLAAQSSGGSAASPAGSLDPGSNGSGVRVGVLDTGIDYTHADFGGAGTAAAYQAARAGDTVGWQPGGAVAGGYDFVGDSYDAAPTTATGANPTYQPLPRPDPNPLDCNGHGTLVAGAIAGRGVTDGRPFGGGDPRPVAGRLPAMDIAPGVAPQASLFAFKVFGCSGATDAVIPALDRALDPNGDGDLSDRLDVVDLSLTSSSAAAEDPETAVLDALPGFGVLPVIAAGQGLDAPSGSSLLGSVRALAVDPAGSLSGSRVAGTPGTGPAASSQTGSAPAALSVADLVVPASAAGAPSVGSGSGTTGAVVSVDPTAVAAGAAALIRQRRPAWTPEQLKAALVDTADDRSSSPVAATSSADVQRVGTDRSLDVGAAAGAEVLAYSSTVPGAVSVAFGVVPADVRQGQVVATAAVVVQNTGLTTTGLSLSYRPTQDQPGVGYQVSPATMALAPGDSALATVTMTIIPAELRRTPADGTSPQQRNPLTGLDEARQYTASARGALLLDSGQGTVQVPVSAAVRPVSATSAADGPASGRTADGTASGRKVAGSSALVLSGAGFSLSSTGDPGSATQQSLLSVLELGYRSPELPPCGRLPDPVATGACSAGGRPADLQAVGVGRTPDTATDAGRLWFGVATYHDLRRVGTDVLPTVDIDVNGDNTADYTVQVQALRGTDLLYALLFDDRSPVARLVDIYPVNFNLGDVDTDAADSNVLLIPVDPTALGYRPGQPSFPIRYSVTLYVADGAADNPAVVDVTPALDYDVAAPALTTANPIWQDQGGTSVPYRLASGSAAVEALVLHLHGSAAQRMQIVRLTG